MTIGPVVAPATPTAPTAGPTAPPPAPVAVAPMPPAPPVDAAAKTALASPPPTAAPAQAVAASSVPVQATETGVPKLIQALRSGQFPTLEQALADKADFLMSFKYALGLIVPKTSWQQYEPKMDEVLGKLYGFLTLLPAQMQMSKQIREFMRPKEAEPAKPAVAEPAANSASTVNAQVTEPVAKREEPKPDEKSGNKREPWWKQIGKFFLNAVALPPTSPEAVKA